MGYRILKSFRVVVSLTFLILFVLSFIDFSEKVPDTVFDIILFPQFIPSFLKFIHVIGWATAGFLFVMVLTLLFGRVYCSMVCPLGIFQDVISYISRKFKKRKRFKYKKPLNIWRYSFLFIPLLLIPFFGNFPLYLLDPYSIFGRIFSLLAKPSFAGLNNLLAAIFESFGNYSVLYPYNYKGGHFGDLVIPVLLLVMILLFAIFRGRLYCNTICPVGTLLGMLSRLSVFKIKIDQDTCTKCGKCLAVCKSECISIKTMSVDFSRCVACFNCLKSCRDDSIHYRFLNAGTIQNETDTSKRDFVKQAGLFAVGMFSFSKVFGNSGKPDAGTPVSPPGSQSIQHFTAHCTACNICVSVCPTQVLQPSFLEYGFTGMLIPQMDYAASYCNFECTKCGEVCPTGAILPLTKEEKKVTQIGMVSFVTGRCVVYTDETFCGSCAEHCPTGAVSMVPYMREGEQVKDLTIPETKPEICIGCGACEYACPVRPVRAIRVISNTIHKVAEKPEIEELETGEDSGFDFLM